MTISKKIVNFLSNNLLIPCIRWISYEEADAIVDNVGKGLIALGQEPKKPLCIFADTRAEWMLTAQACFKLSIPVVTLYTNLGEDAVTHGINETEVDTVITSHELLPKFKNILKSTPKVKNIIFYEKNVKKTLISGKTTKDIETFKYFASICRVQR